MPAHINYETTPIIFYKFVCENPEIKSCYVGQTTNFQQRKNSHKSRCQTEINKMYNAKIYQIIRENGGFDNWKMVEIDRVICLDKSHACKIEQQYIEELQANMNSLNAVTFNWDKWYSNNKDRICRKMKKNYESNFTKIRDKNKINYEKNKNKYLAKQQQKITCDCGIALSFGNKSRHLKSKKHIDYLASKIIS